MVVFALFNENISPSILWSTIKPRSRGIIHFNYLNQFVLAPSCLIVENDFDY